MKDVIFGFLGTGNMGGALASAVSKKTSPAAVVLSNRTRAKAEVLADKLGCAVAENAETAESAKFLFLGVKPQGMRELLASLSDVLGARKDRFVLVTMAAGLTVKTIREMAGGDYPVARIMPNTPAAVGEGVILYAADGLTDEEDATLRDALSGAGQVIVLPEEKIDAGSALSGCGPAFVCMMIEALADGAVACGLPRALALSAAAQTLKGTASLMLETGKHPGALKDEVCSPGGSTIEGVRTLEEGALRASCIDAVIAAYEKTKELGKQ